MYGESNNYCCEKNDRNVTDYWKEHWQIYVDQRKLNSC